MTNKPLSPAIQYLHLVRKRLAAIRKDIPAIIEMAERVAKPLLEGGNLFTPDLSPFWHNEFCSRAGGMMGLKAANYVAQSKKDVAYFTVPDPRRWNPQEDKKFQALVKGPAQLFLNGPKEDLAVLGSTRRFAGFTGGVDPNEGLYAMDPFQPLAPLRPLEMIVRGWRAAGEMICACTRAGRMPILWMSVWLEGAMVRNASFTRHDNLHEPWSAPMFHDDRYISPLAPGYACREFLGELERILDVVEGQEKKLAQAGRWMAQAKKEGRKVLTILVGHSYPQILERPEKAEYAVDFGYSVSNLRRAVPPQYGKGDVALHLGYAPVDVEALQRILDRGIRFIHTSPYGRPANLRDHQNLLWLDLPWRPTDATVDIPGYSVRMMPMSSSAQTPTFFAILCEMAQRMGWT